MSNSTVPTQTNLISPKPIENYSINTSQSKLQPLIFQQYNDKSQDLYTPITTSLISEFEQMTLDTSPKESQFTKFEEDCIREELIDSIDESKLKNQHKQLSFNYNKEHQVRRQQKNKTCEPTQPSPLSPTKSPIKEIIQEVSSPHSQESSSVKDQQLKYIKDLWNNPIDNSPLEQIPTITHSQKVIPIPILNEQKYFEEIILQQQQSQSQSLSQQQINYTYPNQIIQTGLVRPFNSFYSTDNSPQHPQHLQNPKQQYEQDIYISAQIDQLWGNQIISRKMQKMLESGTEEQKELIVQRLERISPQIQKDVFGNYVVQKIFECTNSKLQLRMFNKLKGHFYDLSKNTFGCRVMQKLVEYTFNKEDLQNIVLQQLQPNMRSLIYDVNGNYVIFKMLETYDKSKMQFLIPVVEESFNYMGQQIYGCKIIHKLIQQYQLTQISNLIRLSVQNYAVLSQTEYGNYILQHVLQHWYPSAEKSMLVQLVIQQFYQLSVNKYASNTVERALEVLGKQELHAIMQWLLCRSNNQYNSHFVVLANHQYANYVIKKFLVLSDHSILKVVGDSLLSNPHEFTTIKSTVHGQRISNLLEKQLQNWIQ